MKLLSCMLLGQVPHGCFNVCSSPGVQRMQFFFRATLL